MKNLLDNLGHVQKIDKSDMLDILMDFPGQLKNALGLASAIRPSGDLSGVSNIVFTGVGGSAIAGDFIKCALIDELKIPFVVSRDYSVPAFVDSKTLLFVSSYSGNTEETIGAYLDGKKKKARIILITSGGELEKMAKKDRFPIIKIPSGLPPRCALGYSFVPVMEVLSKVGIIRDKENEIRDSLKEVVKLRDGLIGPEVPLKRNTAKKIASILLNRYAAIYGWSRHMDCVVTRWRNQINENSKAMAQSHFLPELNHNEIMGFSHPGKLLKDIVVIFLRDKDDHIRVKDRIKITSAIIKGRVHKIVEVDSEGGNLIARMCSLIYIGDFVSFYLAILNGEDPTPVDEIAYLKKELAKR